MKTETVFLRKKNLILNFDGTPSQSFKSINQAKRWSRQQQQANGGLGMGFVKRKV
jgi:hypothetical protein